jgi:hypothetical protein
LAHSPLLKLHLNKCSQKFSKITFFTIEGRRRIRHYFFDIWSRFWCRRLKVWITWKSGKNKFFQENSENFFSRNLFFSVFQALVSKSKVATKINKIRFLVYAMRLETWKDNLEKIQKSCKIRKLFGQNSKILLFLQWNW